MQKVRAEELVEILGEQLVVQDRISTAAKMLREAIVSRDLGSITRVLSEYDTLTEQMDSLERDRIDLTKEFSEITIAHPRLTHILPYLPEEYKTKLLGLRTQLQSKIKGNARMNSDNTILLEESLINIHKNVMMIVSAKASHKGYRMNGKSGDAQPRNFVNKVI